MKWVKRKGSWLILAVTVTIFIVGIFALPDAAPAQEIFSDFDEIGGTLPDGQKYLIRVPYDWNGTVLSDLDYANRPNITRNMVLLEMGYALSGLVRHPDRLYNYDPLYQEALNILTVLDMLEDNFGKPDRIIQRGHSGGGHLALAMAEVFPDRIDGAISGCAHTPVWLMNQKLDGWFVLKALLAPELEIVNLPLDQSALVAAWNQVIEEAQQTPEGQARIALAFTIGQWPAWTPDSTDKERDPRDVETLQYSMYESLLNFARRPGGTARLMFENAARGQLSWNTGIDYEEFFNNGETFYKKATRELYRNAGIELHADLEQINNFPRIVADQHAVDWWSVHGRSVTGKLEIPVLSIHSIGDHAVPHQKIQGYESMVRKAGSNMFYRTAFVDNVGHGWGAYSDAESIATVIVMMNRLDTGRWGSSTQPRQLNRLAASLASSLDLENDDARFHSVVLPKYNRTWVPEQLIKP